MTPRSYYCLTTLHGHDGPTRSFVVAFPRGYDVSRWMRYWLKFDGVTAVELEETHE